MRLIPHVRFEDFERRDFEKIASVSILCDKSEENRKGVAVFSRLSAVRQAAQGDALSPTRVAELIDALEEAINDRHIVVSDMQEAGHPDLAKAAEQWYGPLRHCLELAEQARDWVGEPAPLDED